MEGMTSGMSESRPEPSEQAEAVRILLVGALPEDVPWLQEVLGRSRSRHCTMLPLESRLGALARVEGGEVDVALVVHRADGDAQPSDGWVHELAELNLPMVVLCEHDDEWISHQMLNLGAHAVLHFEDVATRLLVSSLASAVDTHRKISDLSGAREQDRRLATHDPLTDLANRYLFHDRLAQALAASRRNSQKMALLFVDLDNFKLVNDTLGHAVGDELLRVVSQVLSGSLRESDTAARIGGDEFALLLTNLGDELDAARIAMKVIDSLRKPLDIRGKSILCTVSIGIATVPRNGDDENELVRQADTAMYHAKKRGRNRYEFFTEQMSAAIVRRVALETGLRTAIDDGSLSVHYQPVFDLRRQRLTGAEALIRWQHSELGALPPDEFLPLAEESGTVLPIGEWVLREACEQALAWQRMGYEGFRIAINVSPRQLQEPKFAESVEQVIRDVGISPKTVELEITESSLMQEATQMIDVLHQLKRLGVSLAVDDFGTGYSALAYLKDLPIDILKIDRFFVSSLVTDPADATIVEAIVRMAQGLNLLTVAEGVEDHAQLLLLGSYGCTRMQGFLLGRPVPPHEFGRWIDEPDFRWGGAKDEVLE
jgi:diguanylate cyclase (GGDEF)-like protein